MEPQQDYRLPQRIIETKKYLDDKLEVGNLTADDKAMIKKMENFYKLLPEGVEDFGELPFYPLEVDSEMIGELNRKTVYMKKRCNEFWCEKKKIENGDRLTTRIYSHLKSGLEILDSLIRY